MKILNCITVLCDLLRDKNDCVYYSLLTKNSWRDGGEPGTCTDRNCFILTRNKNNSSTPALFTLTVQLVKGANHAKVQATSLRSSNKNSFTKRYESTMHGKLLSFVLDNKAAPRGTNVKKNEWEFGATEGTQRKLGKRCACEIELLVLAMEVKEKFSFDDELFHFVSNLGLHRTSKTQSAWIFKIWCVWCLNKRLSWPPRSFGLSLWRKHSCPCMFMLPFAPRYPVLIVDSWRKVLVPSWCPVLVRNNAMS